MQYKGIIFDFNGVLVQDTPLQEKAWKIYAHEHRGNAFDEQEMKIHVHGRPNSHTLTYLLGRPLSKSELEEHIQRKESVYRQLCLDLGNQFCLSPGGVPLLNYLKGHQIPRTIATASEISNLSFFIEHLKLDQWFDVNRIVYDDGTIPGKPEPDIYLKAAENIGLNPSECIVVEDSVSGIEAAKRAGIGFIIALGEKTLHGQLKQLPGVQKVIEVLTAFPKDIVARS